MWGKTNDLLLRLEARITRVEENIETLRIFYNTEKFIKKDYGAPPLVPNDFNVIVERMAPYDILQWRLLQSIRNNNKCPTCNLDFNEMHPLANLYPHWTGECRDDKFTEKHELRKD